MNINKFWTCWAIVSSLVSPLGVTISTPTSEWQAVITWPISRSWCLEKGDWWILAAPPSGAISRQLWLLVEQSSTYYALLERVPLFTVVELIILSLLVLRGRELICVQIIWSFMSIRFPSFLAPQGKGGKTGCSLGSLFSKVSFFEPSPLSWLKASIIGLFLSTGWETGGLARPSPYLEPRSPMHWFVGALCCFHLFREGGKTNSPRISFTLLPYRGGRCW